MANMEAQTSVHLQNSQAKHQFKQVLIWRVAFIVGPLSGCIVSKNEELRGIEFSFIGCRFNRLHQVTQFPEV
jgi:hypothetical protein